MEIDNKLNIIKLIAYESVMDVILVSIMDYIVTNIVDVVNNVISQQLAVININVMHPSSEKTIDVTYKT